MHRLRFVILTGVLLAIAYLLLRALYLGQDQQIIGVFPDGWQFLDPFRILLGTGEQFWFTVSIHVVLTIGLTMISVARSRDAGWRPWIGLLMIIPVVRLFVFTALAAVPSQQRTNALDLPHARFLDRVIPSSRVGSAVSAILIAIMFVLPLGLLNVHMINEYGLALFLGLPFTLGAVSAYLFNYHSARRLGQSIGVALLAVSFALIAIFAFAMEGLLCLIMAAPIVYLIAIPGAIVGHALSQQLNSGVPAMILLLLIAPAMMGFEAAMDERPPVFIVVTAVSIDASQQEVWDQLVAFSRMEEPDEFLFRAGISYPVRATIVGKGVGAVRYCEFNTGPFVEPITTWDEPTLLAFDVRSEPEPMTELSIYEHINAPHVEGFFHSLRGQFKLTTSDNGTVNLEGTTWYTHDIWPTWYWSIWSDAILHRIHGLVLEHIKADAERF